MKITNPIKALVSLCAAPISALLFTYIRLRTLRMVKSNPETRPEGHNKYMAQLMAAQFKGKSMFKFSMQSWTGLGPTDDFYRLIGSYFKLGESDYKQVLGDMMLLGYIDWTYTIQFVPGDKNYVTCKWNA